MSHNVKIIPNVLLLKVNKDSAEDTNEDTNADDNSRNCISNSA